MQLLNTNLALSTAQYLRGCQFTLWNSQWHWNFVFVELRISFNP